MIYTDGTHLIADDLNELHDFARKLGLKREWFQSRSLIPHYDLFGRKKRLAIRKGAMKISSKQIIEMFSPLFKNN